MKNLSKHLSILTFFALVLFSSAAVAQESSYFNSDSTVTYTVKYDNQGKFIDSLFTKFRHCGLRQPAGNGERETMRHVSSPKLSFQYGVHIEYSYHTVQVHFYLFGNQKQRNKYYPLMLNDYYANVDPSAPRYRLPK
jgi:hypothetical protein